MRVDDIMLTVEDFACDKVTKNRIAILQRFFIRKYCTWMSARAIAELTGLKSHACVRDAEKAVETHPVMFDLSLQLTRIFEAKMHNREVNLNIFRMKDAIERMHNRLRNRRA
jgi:hypothetical protein